MYTKKKETNQKRNNRISNLKRAFATIVCVIAVIISFTMVKSVNTYADKKSSDSKVTYSLKKGTLTITGKGKLKKTFANKKIKKIVVEKGITSIPVDAFAKCKNVKYITIAPTVKTIGQCAFNVCPKLKKVTMPGDFKLEKLLGDEENFYLGTSKTICFNTQFKIRTATYVKTNNFKTYKKDKKYKSFGGVIYTKDKKTIVRVPSMRTKLVVEEGCTTLPINSFTYAALDFEGDVEDRVNISKITLPTTLTSVNKKSYFYLRNSIEYENIKVIVNNAKNLKSAELVKLLNISREIGKKYDRTKLVEKSGVYTSGDIFVAYKGESSEVNIPEGIREVNTGAFYENEYIKKVSLPKSLKIIGKYAFSTTKIESINLPDGLETIGDDAFSLTNITEAFIPDSVKTIGEYAFFASKLTNYSLPNSATFGSGAFSSTNITKVIIPSSMTKIPDFAFRDCNNLKKVIIGDSITSIGAHAFSGCENLKEVIIGDSVTSIGDNAFGGCYNLEKITLGKNITNIGSEAFEGTKWSEIVIPESNNNRI